MSAISNISNLSVVLPENCPPLSGNASNQFQKPNPPLPTPLCSPPHLLGTSTVKVFNKIRSLPANPTFDDIGALLSPPVRFTSTAVQSNLQVSKSNPTITSGSACQLSVKPSAPLSPNTILHFSTF